MPTEDRTRVTVHPSLVKEIEKRLPRYKLDQGLTTIVNDLVYSALDSCDTISGPPGRYSYSSSSSLEGLDKSLREGRETFLTPIPISENFVCHNPEDFAKEQKKKLEKESPAFEAFWKVYNTAPSKASNQSKSKAKSAWKTALKTEKADRLVEAAKKAVEDQVGKVSHDEWCAPFPDAYRWLRDECFTVFLEDHTSAQPQRIIPGETCL